MANALDGERRALVAGYLCVDLVPDLTTVSAGEIGGPSTASVGPLHVTVGGAVGNVAPALSRFGIHTETAARVGDDALSAMTCSHLERAGAELTGGVRAMRGEASSYTIVISPAGTERVFWYTPGPNTGFSPDQITDRELENLDVLHVGYVTELPQLADPGGAELGRVLRTAKAAGATTSIDVTRSGGPLDYRGTVLPNLDLFFPSLEEAGDLFFPELPDPPPRTLETLRGIAGPLLEAGLAIVGLTLGDGGLYLKTNGDRGRIGTMGRGGPSEVEDWAGRELFAAPRRVAVRSTAAAGDLAIAGFVATMLRADGTPELALSTAAGAGAWAVEHFDTAANLPGWAELRDRIDSGWELLAPGVELTGWSETPMPGVWAPQP